MARFFPFPNDLPLTDQIKTLGDDELLDFWEETQTLDSYLGEDHYTQPPFPRDYERIILRELQLRSCLRNLTER